MDTAVERSVAPLPEPYHRHLARIVAAVEDDDRIRALWLSGSSARGTADAASDLDLIITVTAEAYDSFAADWREWWEALVPTLIAGRVPGSGLVIYSLTEDLCRIDVVAENRAEVATSPYRSRLPILDRDGVAGEVPAVPEPPAVDPDAIERRITEFWRIQAIFPAMIDGRDDLLCSMAGVINSWRLLVETLIECHGPHPVTGAKHFESKLPPDQVALLRSLPPIATGRDTLIVAALAVAEAMSTTARAAAEPLGVTYPVRIETAVLPELRRLAATVTPGVSG